MAFSKTLVAVDDEEQSRLAVELAFALGPAVGREITLAHVVEAPAFGPELPEAAAGLEWLIEREEESWTERLAELAATLPVAAAVRGEVLVAEKVAPALLELASGGGVDLLVTGTRGAGGLKRRLLGSVSQRLLAEAPCSVLLVREQPTAAERSVLVGVDETELMPEVVEEAQGIAEALAAKLVLAAVAEPLVPSRIEIETHPGVRDWTRAQAERALRAAAGRIDGPLELEGVVREGTARYELLSECEERRPLLTVVGASARRGVADRLLGSTARHLANLAPCPVLAVRAS